MEGQWSGREEARCFQLPFDSEWPLHSSAPRIAEEPKSDCTEFGVHFTFFVLVDCRMRLTDLVPILEIAIGPVILISGVGLLLLSMTNRLGRVIYRSRLLVEAIRKCEPGERPRLTSQLNILSLRARLVRAAIIFATVSVLLAGVLVIALFVAALVKLEIGIVVILLFIGCMGSLIASLVVFIGDINLSLSALKLELEQVS